MERRPLWWLTEPLERHLPWLRAVEAQLLADPAFIHVFARWITWLMAAIIVLTKAAPPVNLRHAEWLLVVTGIFCLGLTLFGGLLRPRLPDAAWVRFLDTSWLTGPLDIILSCVTVSLTGGWGSPFYEFALMSVLSPALRFRFRGALLASSLYAVCYVTAVGLSRGGHGFDGIMMGSGIVDGGFFSSVINPYMIGIVAAYLADVMRRLHLAGVQEERMRVAREIHDGIAQNIFMLTLNLETCADMAKLARPDLPEKLESLLGVARHVLWEVRYYMFDLKPHLSGEKGLSAAVGNLVREFQAVSGIAVEVTVEGAEGEVPVRVSTAVMRIVQEALANAFKHARADRIEVVLRFLPGHVEAEVRDDGQGFDVATPPRVGMGLEGMRSRAAEVGGSLRVESTPQVGSRVLVNLPA
ncbi:MAG: sensor histidine kinase [Candidatus Xenobia bacterium]